MLILYVVLFLVLILTRLLLRGRVALLERKYVRTARAAQLLLQQPVYKAGNGGKPDPYKAARHQYALGRLAEKRDRVEARHAKWQGRSERVGRTLTGLRGWKGRLAPYAFGIADVVLLVLALDHFGVADAGPLKQAVRELASRVIH